MGKHCVWLSVFIFAILVQGDLDDSDSPLARRACSWKLNFLRCPKPKSRIFLNRIAFVRLLLQCRFELMFEKAVGVPSLKLEIMEMSFWETV